MYMDVNDKKEILTWVIPIERSELRKRLSSAVQVENKFTMGISSNNGTFKNGNKTFNISLITVKSVERPCLIRVSEVDKPETQKSFIIKGEKAKEVQNWLDNTLEASAKTLVPINKEKVKSLEEIFRELEEKNKHNQKVD